MKTKTMTLQGNEYAQVKDRLQEFRSANPRGLIETTPTIQADGSIMFKARIVKDKADANSAEASGHAFGKDSKKLKEFEKLETIAVGRALALLGYASNGEIASSEEMVDFLEYQKEKAETLVQNWRERLDGVQSAEELRTLWADMPVEVKQALTDYKDELKKKYEGK